MGDPTHKKPSELAAETLRHLSREGLPPTPWNYAEAYFRMEVPPGKETLCDLLEVSSIFAQMEEDSWTLRQLEALGRLLPQFHLLSERETGREVHFILKDILTRNRNFLKEVLEDKKQFQRTVLFLNQMISQVSGTLEKASFKLERNVEILNQSKSLEEAKTVFQKITEESRDLLSTIKKMGNDILTANKQLMASSIEANLDPLTGILNRRGLQRKQGSFVGKRIVFMVFDADHFKALNDQHGHAAGDLFLRQLVLFVARQLEEMIFSFCRWGGDEFLVVFEGEALETIVEKAERIQKELPTGVDSPRIFLPGSQKNHVTLSIGLSGGDYGALSDFERFFSLADKALYQAKQDGRNLVRAIHLDDHPGQ
ncbi:MAG: GGDEF domain-containing protein [Nitrospiraceae bacterium]|nr:GGDEF domain-containing protein [Nitrospiraceae bacterium]